MEVFWIQEVTDRRQACNVTSANVVLPSTFKLFPKENERSQSSYSLAEVIFWDYVAHRVTVFPYWFIYSKKHICFVIDLGRSLRFCSFGELPSPCHAVELGLSRSTMFSARAKQGPSRKCNICWCHRLWAWSSKWSSFLMPVQRHSTQSNTCVETSWAEKWGL